MTIERLDGITTLPKQILGGTQENQAARDQSGERILERPTPADRHRIPTGDTVEISPKAHRLNALQQSIEHGCNALTLEVRISNEPAQALYKRFGLVPAGVRRGYYEPDDEDALVMWARDIDTPRYRDRMERLMHELEAAA